MTVQPPEMSQNPKAAAAAAKAYAKAERPWYKKKRFMIPLAVLVVGAIASGGGGGGDKDDTTTTSSDTNTSDSPATAPKDEASEEPKAEKPKPKPLMVEASVMLKEFEENELAADAKYKDKRVQVTGVINKVDTEPFDENDYILKVAGGGEFEIITVDCYDIPNSKLSALKQGDKVTMVGDFKDGGDLGVNLNHCKLV